MRFPKNLRNLFILALLVSFGLASCSKKREGDPKVLIFSKTEGYRHQSIPSGIAAIQKLGAENGFDVDTTENAELINEENLSQYSAVIFLSTTSNILDHYQEADFERYIQSGGGFVGIHAAADTEYEWGWFNKLVGGYFADHPGINDPHPNVQPGVVNVEDATHPTTSFLPAKWERTDEWYSYKKIFGGINVLLTLDEDSYKGGLDMGEHPIAWYHEFDGGRAFYTGGGHTNESFEEELFLKHILAGIQYAIGDNLELNYSAARTKRVPEENRFAKTMLTMGEFTEPTEMTILPNLDILVVQRRGEILRYNNESGELSEIGKLDVYWKTDVAGVNAEEGLMGIQKDPNFESNGHVFVYYAPSGDEWVNRLSRFTYKDGNWDMDSETVILDVASDRNICCHTGGSIAFDAEGNLFLSTGDNSTPFNQNDSEYILNGYAPLDQRSGREQWDARRSSGNANDLRGKILRIKVNEDGSYSIPEGNLYAGDIDGTRPEIFVQGNRNPYRISVDQKKGWLYWGEVGPDARIDSLDSRGPRGYDEVNQARQAGNFGWPYFVGDNYPYYEFDFVNGKSIGAFDPMKPVNNSPNNTGIKELPPAQPAFIWYPYADSPEFPAVGSGGRNAMAGPVYYPDLYSGEGKIPDYYEGKLFIYDWIRGWVKAVTMDENGDFSKMEPFMENTKFNALIDMEMGPDGKMYILEYGNGWFSKNEDSGLSRIDFNGGNRAPTIAGVSADKASGKAPLTVNFTADGADPEDDALSYVWDLGNGETQTTDGPTLNYTFDEIGEYQVSVKSQDPGGLESGSMTALVYAGNDAPVVDIEIEGNQTFYFPGKQVKYSVNVTDADTEGELDMSTLYVSADYMEGIDQAEADMGHKIVSDAMVGKSLVQSLTCKTCHKEAEASIGPAYTEVAAKYSESDREYIASKIMNGGSGVWGEVAMPANPNLKEAEVRALVSYIFSLDGSAAEPSLPQSGSVDPTQGKAATPTGVMVMTASFTDAGGEGIKPLSGSKSVTLRNNFIDLGTASDLEGGYSAIAFNGQNLLVVPKEPASFSVGTVDLTDIAAVMLPTASMAPLEEEVIFELRLDSADGTKIGEGTFTQGPVGPAPPYASAVMIPITEATSGMHKIYVTSRAKNGGTLGTFVVAGAIFNSK